MSDSSRRPRLDLDRRRFFEATSAIAAAAAMPRILAIPRAMAQAGATMVVAAPATPQSLDCNFDVSLGTFEAIAALYDGLLGFNKIPDAGVPTALREDIAYHADKPGGVNMYGKLAESWANQALVYERRGDKAKAAKSYQQAVRLDPNYKPAVDGLARTKGS